MDSWEENKNEESPTKMSIFDFFNEIFTAYVVFGGG
jgi:hypothetical protein